MFKKNRVMIIHDEEIILVHLNGKEITRIYDIWDSIDAIEDITKGINKLSDIIKQREFIFICLEADNIDIEDKARDLLYSVQQFTQEEEKALFTKNWELLNQLLLQRIEDKK